jgi:hypothetical protein
MALSELLLFNAKWTISQKYHGENKLYFHAVLRSKSKDCLARTLRMMCPSGDTCLLFYWVSTTKI